jgi:DNA-binding transcriptional LysR family regulator
MDVQKVLHYRKHIYDVEVIFMDINQLYCFKEICRCGSMAQAARNLYHSTQNLSRIVKALEEELGVVLLYRSATGVELTESGKCLLEHSKKILKEHRMLQRDLKLIQQTYLGEVDLLSAYGVLRLVQPESILAFQKQHPEIRVKYREYPDLAVEKLFDQKEGNVALSIAPFDEGKYDVTEIATFPFSVIVHQDHPLATRKFAHITDLKGEDLYLESEDFKIHHIIKDACQQAGFEPNIVFQTNGFSLCKSVVSRGSGISVVVDDIYQEMGDSNIVKVPFAPEENLKWIVCMITRCGEPMTEVVKEFQKFVKKRMLKL